MPKELGKALQKAITVEQHTVDHPGKRFGRPGNDEALLFNSTRRELFQQICLQPCSTVRDLARALELSPPTIDWHVTRMLEAGIISYKKLGRSRVYYPTDLISTEGVAALALLNQEKARAITRLVMSTPGLNQQELCSRSGMYQQEAAAQLSRLEDVGVIVVLKDGRSRRYYPADIPWASPDVLRKRRRLFKKNLLEYLNASHLDTRIVRSRGSELVIEMSRGSKQFLLKLSLPNYPDLL